MTQRKFIFIEIDDEISAILNKVEKGRVDMIGLMFPEKALIFQSLINLKLLKQSLEEMQKDVVVTTEDPAGLKLLEKVGFQLYKPQRKIKAEKELEQSSDPVIRIQQLKPKNPSLKPQKSGYRKLSLTELIAMEEKKRRDQVVKKDISKELEQDSSSFKMWSEKLLNLTIKRRNFILFFVGALSVFLCISYVALPSATIYIKPASNVVEKTTNLLLVDLATRDRLRGPERAHAIATFPVEAVIDTETTLHTSGNVFTGSHAEGKITIFNTRQREWILVENTRFQSLEGIVMRSKERVEVPGATFVASRNEAGDIEQQKVPGQLTIEVVVDERDIGGSIVGERGNIPAGTKLTLPALEAAAQETIYAQTSEDFHGGTSEAYSVLTNEDIELAKNKTIADLEAGAMQEFENFIAAQNTEKGLHLTLLNDPQFMNSKIIELKTPTDLIGTEAETVTVYAKMQINGIAFDREEYYRVLENELKSKVHPQKRLLAIDRNSTTYRVVSSDSQAGNLQRIKIAVTIKGVEEFELNARTKNGADLIQKINTSILGKKLNEAKYYIQNLEEVSQVEISLWPFWSASIPSLESGIKIKLR